MLVATPTLRYSYLSTYTTPLHVYRSALGTTLFLLTHVSLAVLFALVVLFIVYAAQQLVLVSFVSSGGVIFNLLAPLVACLLAVCVFVLSNPMHALLSLVGVFIATIALYVYAGIEFIGLVTLIVYVGAVAILFLFVIMLLNVKSLTSAATLIKYYSQYVTLGFGAAFAVFLQSYLVRPLGAVAHSPVAPIMSSPGHIFTSVHFAVVYRAADVNAIADLYTTHSVLFWLTTANLLLALLGSIILAMSTTEQPRFVAAVALLSARDRDRYRVASS